jgi:hypothetical protein
MFAAIQMLRGSRAESPGLASLRAVGKCNPSSQRLNGISVQNRTSDERKSQIQNPEISKRPAMCSSHSGVMVVNKAKADQLQQRLIDFGARTIRVGNVLPRTNERRYIWTLIHREFVHTFSAEEGNRSLRQFWLLLLRKWHGLIPVC